MIEWFVFGFVTAVYLGLQTFFCWLVSHVVPWPWAVPVGVVLTFAGVAWVVRPSR